MCPPFACIYSLLLIYKKLLSDTQPQPESLFLWVYSAVSHQYAAGIRKSNTRFSRCNQVNSQLEYTRCVNVTLIINKCFRRHNNNNWATWWLQSTAVAKAILSFGYNHNQSRSFEQPGIRRLRWATLTTRKRRSACTCTPPPVLVCDIRVSPCTRKAFFQPTKLHFLNHYWFCSFLGFFLPDWGADLKNTSGKSFELAKQMMLNTFKIIKPA